MHLQTLKLRNYRALQDLAISFEKDLTIVAGVNGIGKSSVLDAIACGLSYIQKKRGVTSDREQFIEDDDIRFHTNFAEISTTLTSGGSVITKRLGETATTRFESLPTDPTIAIYYSVDRASFSYPKTLVPTAQTGIKAASKGALRSEKIDLRSFMQWYLVRKKLGKLSQELTNALEVALTTLLPGFANMTIEDKPPRLYLEKDGERLNLSKLSSGEKSLIAIVIDLARRLATANPESDKPLQEGQAIVLIDEIELHLHPKWQIAVTKLLLKIFPATQFIITTHSPQVLREVEAQCIRYCSQSRDTGLVNINSFEYGLGLDSSEALEFLMDVPARNPEFVSQLDEIHQLIDQEKFQEAKAKVTKYLNQYGEIPDLVALDQSIDLDLEWSAEECSDS